MNDPLPSAADILRREAAKATTYAEAMIREGADDEAARYHCHAAQLNNAARELDRRTQFLLG